MSHIHSAFAEHLDAAKEAIEQLEKHGCVPRSINICGPKPVIVIDAPTEQSFLRGAMRMRVRVGQKLRQTMAAPFFGCRVEWAVDTQPVITARFGGTFAH